MVSLVDITAGDFKIDFMRPHGPQNTFNWPRRSDSCCFCEKHYSKDTNSYYNYWDNLQNK